MIANPEFRRNLWLELSPHRLVAVALGLGAAMIAIYLLSADTPLGGSVVANGRVVTVARWAFAILVLLWGGRLAAGAVIAEISERTWDDQRLTALGPWAMAIGKLFGSTVVAWYGGAIAILAYVIAAAEFQSAALIAARIALLVSLGVLCHGATLAFSLLAIQNRTADRRPGITLVQLVGLAPIALLYGARARFEESADQWYGVTLTADEFTLLSAMAFAAWAVVAAYRMMRAELQVGSRPWASIAFVVFLAFYVEGLSPPDLVPGARLVQASLVVFACAYFMALAGPKDAAGFRRLTSNLRRGEWPRVLEGVPLWLVGYGLALLAATAVVVVMLATEGAGEMTGQALSFYGALALFLTRDLAILLALHLGRKPHRASLAALVCWAVLYGLVPGLLKAAGWREAFPAFLPIPGAEPLIAVGPVLLQAVLLAGFLGYRWRAYQADLGGPHGPS